MVVLLMGEGEEKQRDTYRSADITSFVLEGGGRLSYRPVAASAIAGALVGVVYKIAEVIVRGLVFFAWGLDELETSTFQFDDRHI
jgi:hypothetical protein